MIEQTDILEVTQKKEYIYCSIVKLENLKEKYMLRLELIDYKKNSKTEYEKNENEITKIKTNLLIDQLNDKIKDWQQVFDEVCE